MAIAKPVARHRPASYWASWRQKHLVHHGFHAPRPTSPGEGLCGRRRGRRRRPSPNMLPPSSRPFERTVRVEPAAEHSQLPVVAATRHPRSGQCRSAKIKERKERKDDTTGPSRILESRRMECGANFTVPYCIYCRYNYKSESPHT